MKVVERIKEPIYEEMELFESQTSCLPSLYSIELPLYCQQKRKQRPVCFLVAKMLGKGKINERSYRGAAVIELIHTATLVHDDVVDDSNQRRDSFPSMRCGKTKLRFCGRLPASRVVLSIEMKILIC